MVKEPRAGHVKTRLAREIGTAAALRFYRANTASLIMRLGHDPRWQFVLAVAPDSAIGSRAWSGAIPRIAQGRGDLGARMLRLLHTPGPLETLIIGSDIPGIRAQSIADAFRLLGTHDAVFGPAGDGGYWLIGLKPRNRLAGLFAAVRWSSPHALGDTLKNLGGRRVGFTEVLDDVDDAASFAEHAQIGMQVTIPAHESPVRSDSSAHREALPLQGHPFRV